NVQIDENEPEISFDGGHHGDEIMGAEVLILMMRDLCLEYGSNPQITNLVNNREIWFFPFINPDGRMSLTRYNNAGVDINRDWGYMWDAWGGSTAPFSQPESQAPRAWINENQFVISQSNHGGIECISYPWSYRSNQCPDNNPINYLAAGYSSTSAYANLPYYQGFTGMYPINGSAKDSYYGIMGSVGWSMEVSQDKTPPTSQIPLYYGYNKPALIYLIEMASRGIKGLATDAGSGQGVAAIVWASNSNGDFWPVYSDPEVGDFHKFLLPGTYDVTITANGYQSTTIQNVVVADTGATAVNVQLQPQTGTYGYRIIYSRIPNNNELDEGYTPAALSAPDNIRYSMGRNGYIVIDMGETIANFPGNDLRVIEDDPTPEGYTVLVGNGWNGPWTSLGLGLGTQDFDLAGSGLSEFRFIRIEDDGDGPATGANIGFDLDAVEGRLIPSSGPFVMATEYMIWDSTSNSNLTLEAGETVSLYLDVQNLGVDPAQNVYVKIDQGSSLLTVHNDSSWVGNLPSQQTSNAGPYLITADAATPHNSNQNLLVSIYADGGNNWNHALPIKVMQGAKLIPQASMVQFPNSFINNISDFPFTIQNGGMDTLVISDFLTVTPQFWVQETSLQLLPGAQETIHIRFQPDDTLYFTDTLTILNNDPVQFEHKIFIEGTGIYAPAIQVSPDSLVAQLNQNDSIDLTLTLSNQGAGELIFTAQVGNYQPAIILPEGAGGNDSYGHIWIDSDEPGGPQYDWIEIGTGSGTLIPLSGLNSASSAIPIGFTVSFYGEDYNTLRVCNNGWLSFNTVSVSYNNTELPSNLAPRALIAALWDNLNMQTDSRVYYFADTTRFIVQWENLYTATGFGPYTFQAIIFKNGNIVLQYKTLTNLENTYTVGMQNHAADDGFHIAFNESYLHDLMAILITKRSWISLNPVGGTIAPGSQTDIIVSLNSKNFPLGDFWASVEIFSNDPQAGHLVIPIHMKVDSILTGIAGTPEIPQDYQLFQNYPNPFNPTTTIRYGLKQASDVKLKIYNLLGQEVRTLISAQQEAGYQSIVWDGRDNRGTPVASGIYIYQLAANPATGVGQSFTSTRKMILMK
ncbi:MAG: carboxypeptidase regulatory-like domain-containing protein, partial [Calditrichia bacterium]|nr:carboxypeptidase regulatory-like domain-containing protein [Calditrichia bacterium]